MRISDWSSDVCSSDLHLGRRQKLFVGSQLFCAAAVEEPGRLVAAGADGSLDRAQDGQRITLGTIEQVMARHVALLCALSTAGLSHHARAARGGRSEEHTSELPSLMRISYAVFCLKK